jgi:hypothetical protein
MQDAWRETARMNHGVGEHQKSSADARWWNPGPSLGEIAEQLERALADKRALESRLADILEENRRLCLRYGKQFQDKSGAGRQVAELAARERLLKDEWERKVQALQVELNKERHQLNKERNQYAKHIEKMELDRASCICRSVQSLHVEQNNVRASAVLPESWRIQDSK